jgi:DNA integrity scanning protein DisA with diadenylate cyclase activity
MNVKMYFGAIIICFVCFVVGAGVGALVVSGANKGTNERAATELDAAAGVNQQVRVEQQSTLDGVSRSIDALERIGSITQEANSTLGELGASNRRSTSILEQIEAELDVLENYLRGVSSVLSDYNRGDGSE